MSATSDGARHDSRGNGAAALTGGSGVSEVTDPIRATRSVSVRVSWLTLLAVTSMAAFAWAFVEVRAVLLVLFVSVFLAAVLDPPVEALARRMRIGRGVASLIVVGAALLALLVIITLALSPVVDGVRSLAHDAPKIVQEIRQSSIGKAIDRHSAAPDTTQAQITSFVNGVGKAAGGALGLASSAFGAVVTVFSLIFMTLFLVMDLPKFRRAIGGILYPRQRERVDHTIKAIIAMTSRYMLGNITISVICGAVYGVTAVILGVPYPLALAVIAGVLDLVPNIGSLIAGIIVAAVALTVSARRRRGVRDRRARLPAVRELRPAAHNRRARRRRPGLLRHRQRPRLRRAVRRGRRDPRRADLRRRADHRARGHQRPARGHRPRRDGI